MYRDDVNMRQKCKTDGCLFDSLMDWSDLVDVFPRDIRPTDIDLFVEVNRHFLTLEEKRVGAESPRGQELCFQRMADQPRNTVVYYQALDPAGSQLKVKILTKDDTEAPWLDFTRPEFREYLSGWGAWAETQPGYKPHPFYMPLHEYVRWDEVENHAAELDRVVRGITELVDKAHANNETAVDTSALVALITGENNV